MFEPNVDGIIENISKLVKKLEVAANYHMDKASEHLLIHEQSKAEATRAARIKSRLEGLLE